MQRPQIAGILGMAVGLAALVAPPASAQQPRPDVDVITPAPVRPAPEFRFEPTAPLEQRGSREQEFYPGPVRSRHDPAFLVPVVSTVPVTRSSALRVGLSGWSAPAVPFDIPQATGGAAFGLTIQWGVPISEGKPPQTPEPSQR